MLFTKRPGLKQGERVMVAMSGGVDSSVAALLLQEAGYRPVGVTLRLWVEPHANKKKPSENWGCSFPDPVLEAENVAQTLHIPHYVLNREEVFYEHVIRYFFREYLGGRTPNPCLACNRYLKFSLLLQKAREMGINYLATGHYARAIYDPANGRYKLLRAIDRGKDQSYMLFTFHQEQLRSVLFPLGNLGKGEVKKMASQAGLEVARRRESQEICFIPDHDYRGFLERECPLALAPGDILSLSGEKLGRHKGVAFYTIGQRKGLGLTSPVPLYVVRIDSQNNILVVGEEKQTYSKGLIAEDVNFISGAVPFEPQKVEVKIRYRAPFVPAVLFPPTGPGSRLLFAREQKAVTPGQAVVFYSGEEVLGGGIISAPLSF